MLRESFFKIYFPLILWTCGFYGYASEKLPPTSLIKQARNSVVLLYDPFSDLSGTGFLRNSNQLITSARIIRSLLKYDEINITLVVHTGNKVTIYDLQIEKLIALDEISNLALLEIKDKKTGFPLKIRNTPPTSEEELFVLGYRKGEFHILKKISSMEKFLQEQWFSVDYSNLQGISGSPVVDIQGQMIGVVTNTKRNIVFLQNTDQLKSFTEGKQGVLCESHNPRACLKESMTLLYKKAEENDISAQYQLALMYHYGEGVKQNNQKAVELLKLAAEKGHPRAQELLNKIISP